jgi:hypothetical protein
MEEQKSDINLELTRASVYNINTIRKWTMFLSVLGFVMIGFVVVFGFSLGFIIEKIGGDTGAPFPYFIMGFIYLVIGIIYFFPILYLYRFSTHAKKSIEENDSDALTNAFRFLKDHYVYMGILMALATGLYLLSMIVLAIVALIM